VGRAVSPPDCVPGKLRAARAAAKALDEQGLPIFVADICRRSALSPDTFFSYFRSADECLAFSCSYGFDLLFAEVGSDDEKPWLEQMVRSIDSFYRAVPNDPDLAALCLVHSSQIADLNARCGADAAVARMESLLQGGRRAGRASIGAAEPTPPLFLDRYLASMIVSLAALRLRQGRAGELPKEAGEIATLVVRPFCGEEPAEAAVAQVLADRGAGLARLKK
jgi:AcrR family transcriptional regulator